MAVSSVETFCARHFAGMAERVGFVHARDAPKARRSLTEDTRDAKIERK
jgi:hypothetical protein